MSGSKKQTIGHRYSLGFHMIFSHGPVDFISHILSDDKVAWQGFNTGNTSINVDAVNLYGGDEKEGGISGQFDVMMGGPSQVQNAYLNGAIGGLIPAFRGVFGVVAKKAYVGTTTYLKKFAVRASRIHLRTSEGIVQWHDAKAEIINDSGTPPIVYNSSWEYQVAGPSTNPPFPEVEVPPLSGYSVGNAPFGNNYSTPYVVNTTWPLSTSLWLRKVINITRPGTYLLSGTVENCGHFYLDGVYFNSFNKTNADLPSALPFEFFLTLSAGNHTLAVLAVDDELSEGSILNYFYADLHMVNQADMNPAHIIRECLTDRDWGMGYQESDVDDVSFTAAADTLHAEKMGMSLLWNTQTPIEDFIKQVCKHIDASLFVDKGTGKFTLKLIRFDYEASELPLLDPSNIDHISDFTRPAFGELTNSVTIQFWDSATYRDSSVTVQDIALAQMQNATINTTIEYPGFTNSNLASRVAQRDLKTLSTPVASCTIFSNRESADLNIGSAIRWSWPDYGIDEMVMRVVGIAYGDGKTNRVRLQVTQDVYSTPLVAVITPEPPYTPPSTEPTPATNRVIYEIPYYEAVQQQGQTAVDALTTVNPDIGYIGAAAGRVPYGIDAQIAIDAGGGYLIEDTFEFSPTAQLAADLDISTTTFALANAAEIEAAADGTFFQVDAEIMVKVSYVAPNLTVKRGALDTVPAEHLANALLIFWDEVSSLGATQFVAGETPNVKVLPSTFSGYLPLEYAPVDALPIVGRMAKPYPPANVKMNGAYYPEYITGELSLTWNHRDRTLQTGGAILGFLDASVGPETGTTYTVRFLNELNVLLREVTGISGASYTYPEAIEEADSGGSLNDVLKIEIESVRDSLVSYQKFAWTVLRDLAPPVVTYSFAFLSPIDKTSEITLSGSNLTATRSSGSAWKGIRSNIGKRKGKWYFEIKNAANGSTTGDAIWGFMQNLDSLDTYPGNASLGATSFGWQANNSPDSSKFQNGSLGAVSSYGTVGVNQYAYIAIDLDAGKAWVKNSSAAGWAGGGDPAAGTSPTFTFTPNLNLHPTISAYSGPQAATINFGATAFNGSVPADFESGWFAPSVPFTPVFDSNFTTGTTNDAQGVATNGVHVWYSSSTTIYKYTKTGTLVTSRNVSGDAPSTKTQINGMFIKDGILYVSAAENSTPRKSYVVQYDPDTLAYITHNQIIGDWFSEGMAFKNGHWWMIFHANKVVAKIDPATWAVVATYNLDFAITGSSGGYGSGTGYDGVAWFPGSDYLICNIHEIYNEKTIDIYYFDGTDFIECGRIEKPTPRCTQGFAFDPVDTDVMWFAERNTDCVAKILI